MTTLLIVLHISVCIFLICIVLLQQGKGADIGASFGGSNQSLFGAEGPLPLLNKLTTAVAIIFMLTSITLAYLSAHKSTRSVMKEANIESQAPTQSQEIPLPAPVSEANKIPVDARPKKSAP